jgi:hypothetical protein
LTWSLYIFIVTWRLKVGIVEPEETFIARQRYGKLVSAATIRKQQQRNCWERCFLFGPCKVVIKKGSVENRQSSSGVPSEQSV